MSNSVRLRNAPAPPAPKRPDATPRVPLVRLRSFAWLAVVGGIVLLALVLGTPHLRFEYLYQGSRQQPFYLRCVYLGMPGFQVIEPRDGQCPLVRLMRPAPSRSAS